MYLLRTDSFGNLLWNKTYSETEENSSSGFKMTSGVDVVECDDNGFAITGATASGAKYFPNNIWLVRTDESGTPLWNITRESDVHDSPRAMAPMGNTSFIIVASTCESSISNEYDTMVVMVDDRAPTTTSSSTTSQGTVIILYQSAIILSIFGVGMAAIILYKKFKESEQTSGIVRF